MAERDLRRADLGCDLVERAAAQARAEAAHRLAFGHEALDDAIRVLLDDAELQAARRQVLGQHMAGEAGLLLVEIDRDDLEVEPRALAQFAEDVEQRVAVLAAGDADHDAVARFDHREVDDRLADQAVQPLAELDDVDRGFLARRRFGLVSGDQAGHDFYNGWMHADVDASSVSATLVARIGAAIDRGGGWLPFSRFLAVGDGRRDGSGK